MVLDQVFSLMSRGQYNPLKLHKFLDKMRGDCDDDEGFIDALNNSWARFKINWVPLDLLPQINKQICDFLIAKLTSSRDPGVQNICAGKLSNYLYDEVNVKKALTYLQDPFYEVQKCVYSPKYALSFI